MAQEVCCAGTIDDLSSLLKGYRVPPAMPVLTLAEMQPLTRVEPAQRQQLLHFAPFESAFDLTHYTSGRIFHEEGELRWEKQASAWQVVYTGQEQYRPAFKVTASIELDARSSTERRYYLFGKRLAITEVQRIGPPAQAGDFAEVRIPRLLRYPDESGKTRVKLVVREYSDPASGAGVASRFVKLVGAEEGL